jgi:hypothetical protein
VTVRSRIRIAAAWTAWLGATLIPPEVAAQSANAADAARAAVVDHWTSERRAAAIPRDLVVDPRGLGYIRRADGTLLPHGHDVAARAGGAAPKAGPPGPGDTTAPTIANMDPAAGAFIGASYTFKATVTDTGTGVRSVTFYVQKGGGTVQSFAAAKIAGTDVWSVALQGFTDGAWQWWVVAKDGAAKGGNTKTSGSVAFAVDIGGGGGGGGGGSGGNVNDAEWPPGSNGGGVVQQAAGRIYFEMPSNSKRTRWVGYVCSGTVVDDGASDRSIVLTAAHCVYDDTYKAFARKVMFIPDQAGTSGGGTDLNCGNDPLGCWVPSIGVVDVDWTTRKFPDNVAWDYAFYVVKDSGMHQGAAAPSALDAAVEPMSISFAAPAVNAAGTGDFTHALGYSYDSDPQFMYCAEDMTTQGAVNWWLPGCGLTGGSSGGPWVQPMDASAGDGPIISVNSWGYTNQPGMAGPKLSGTSASCVFGMARTTGALGGSWADGNAGVTWSGSCP